MPAYRCESDFNVLMQNEVRSRGFVPMVGAYAFAYPILLVPFLVLSIGPNFLLALLSGFVAVVGYKCLHRPGEPPVLAFLFFYQWLESSINIFYGNILGLSVDKVSYIGGNQVLSIILMLIALMSMALGLFLGAGPKIKYSKDEDNENISSYNNWLYFYTICWPISFFAFILSHYVPSLSQPLIILISIKWVAYFGITYLTFARPRVNKSVWIGIFFLEFISSFGGFFSSFKDIFIYTIIGIGASGVKLSRGRVIIISVLTIMMLFFAVVWTAIKGDYRTFVNGGLESQEVLVGRGDALTFIVGRLGELDGEALGDAVESLVQRIGYNDYFGVVTDNVPDFLPHTSGNIWSDAFIRVLTPRILFPNKATLDDSAQTNDYTLLEVAGSERGVSISLGYLTESYIDFGRYGMMVVIFLWGYILGRIYRYFIQYKSGNPLLSTSFVPYALSPVTSLETSVAKMVGGIAISFLICACLLSIASGRLGDILLKRTWKF